VSVSTFLEGVLASPDSGQVGGSSAEGRRTSSFVLPKPGQVSGSSRLVSCLHSDLLDLFSRSSMFDFVHTLRSFSFFGSPCTLRDLSGAMPSLRFDMTSSRPLRLHVDRGLVRHGYPWVPTDQGLSRPRQAGPTYQKTRRPVCGPCPT
jgi:hypothetical protein